jgi:outer membrane protein assembly factor BamB
VNSENGQEKWKFRTEEWILSSPIVADGIVYLGGFDGYLYAVDTETGQEKWKFKTGGAIESSPSIANGVVYIGSLDGYLYAVQ